MRKPISTQEAERIVCNGGTVWRGKLSYKIVRGLLCQICEIYGEGIPWSEFNCLSNFEAEGTDIPGDQGGTWSPDAPVKISQSQWMTPGQAVEWFGKHQDQRHDAASDPLIAQDGFQWRMAGFDRLEIRHKDGNWCQCSLSRFMKSSFREPTPAVGLPKLPEGCEWIRENNQVVSVREPNPLLGDTYTMVLQSQKSRDICAALVQLWDQEHASK